MERASVWRAAGSDEDRRSPLNRCFPQERGGVHHAREFSCFLVWHRLVGTQVSVRRDQGFIGLPCASVMTGEMINQ